VDSIIGYVAAIAPTPSKEEALDKLRTLSGLSDWEGEEDDAIIAYEALRRRVRETPLTNHGLFAELILKTGSIKDLFRIAPMGKVQCFDANHWTPCQKSVFNMKLQAYVADTLQDLLRTYDYDGEFHPSPARGDLTKSSFINGVVTAMKPSLIM
jgi:hypothetical protein